MSLFLKLTFFWLALILFAGMIYHIITLHMKERRRRENHRREREWLIEWLREESKMIEKPPILRKTTITIRLF